MNKLIISILTIVCFLSNYGISQTTTADIPHHELRPFFSFTTFPKGFDEDVIHQSLAYLQNKNIDSWDGSDSLQFMNDLTLIGDYISAYQIYLTLKLDTVRSLSTIHTIQFLLFKKGKQEILMDWYNKEAKDYPNSKQRVEIRRRIAIVYQKMADKKWSHRDSLLFPHLKDTSWYSLKKGSLEFKSELISLVNTYDQALRIEVIYQMDNNNSLSQAYREFGDFLYEHVDYTDAFIAYYCARFYNRQSMHVAKNIKKTKNALRDNNLLLPSFRRIFPKEKKGLFNYQILKEKIKQQKLDSISASSQNPLPMVVTKHKKEYLPRINKSLIFLGGVTLILVFVLLFVKTKRRRRSKINPEEVEEQITKED